MFPSQVSCTLAQSPPPRQAFDPAQIRGIREDPRMAEQQFGNLQDAAQVLRPPLSPPPPCAEWRDAHPPRVRGGGKRLAFVGSRRSVPTALE